MLAYVSENATDLEWQPLEPLHSGECEMNHFNQDCSDATQLKMEACMEVIVRLLCICLARLGVNICKYCPVQGLS